MTGDRQTVKHPKKTQLGPKVRRNSAWKVQSRDSFWWGKRKRNQSIKSIEDENGECQQEGGPAGFSVVENGPEEEGGGVRRTRGISPTEGIDGRQFRKVLGGFRMQSQLLGEVQIREMWGRKEGGKTETSQWVDVIRGNLSKNKAGPLYSRTRDQQVVQGGGTDKN